MFQQLLLNLFHLSNIDETNIVCTRSARHIYQGLGRFSKLPCDTWCPIPGVEAVWGWDIKCDLCGPVEPEWEARVVVANAFSPIDRAVSGAVSRKQGLPGDGRRGNR